MVDEYRGLLECPFQQGYVEFTFKRGDLVEELRNCLAAEWETEAAVFMDSMIAVKHDWVFFANDGPDSYVRLLLSDEIPVEASAQAHLPEIQGDHVIQPYGKGGPPYIELGRYAAFADSFIESLEIYDKKLEETKFRVRVKLASPKAGPYSVRLIALVAIVGG
jgi:hypothetical protein